MPTDLTPIISIDRPEARQLATQRGAVGQLEQFNRLGRVPDRIADMAAAQALVAQAKAALGRSADAAKERFAERLADLRGIRVEDGPIHEIDGDARRVIAECRLIRRAEYEGARRAFVEARMGRLAYEKDNPKAPLLRTAAFRIRIAATIFAGFEIPAGTYLLWQASNFPGGPIGGFIGASVMFLGNMKLALTTGILAGRKRKTRSRGAASLLGALGAAGIAGAANLMLGCLRSDLPFNLSSIAALIADPIEHLPAWVLISMEASVFVGSLGWSLAREHAGDTSDYRRLCLREAEAKRVFKNQRVAFVHSLNAETDDHCAAIDEVERGAEDAWADARAIYEDVHAERRTLLRNRAEIVRETASVFRDIYELAVGQFHGTAPARTPEFEQEFERLITLADAGDAELALARRTFKDVRAACRAVVCSARRARASIADARLEALRPIYATP